jgi:hypothetical protein
MDKDVMQGVPDQQIKKKSLVGEIVETAADFAAIARMSEGGSASDTLPDIGNIAAEVAESGEGILGGIVEGAVELIVGLFE